MRSAVTMIALAAVALSAGGEMESTTPAQAHEHAESSSGSPPTPARAGMLPDGYSAVDLGAERTQKFGVRTERVRREALTREVRTVGIVRTDETRESHVHVKWRGWIEEFFVSFVGQNVKQGDPLFTVYSPELVTAQQELLVARTRVVAARDLDRPEELASAESLLDAARMKLHLFDVPDDAIAKVEESGRLIRALTVRSPRSGTVIEKMVVPGMYVDSPMDLYTIADLSRVWVLADLYEYETPYVQVGQSATFSLVGAGAESPAIQSVVVFIDPTVEPRTRTVKMRLELANENGELRPGAYGTVRLQIPLGESLTVPADSVLDTGARQIVFVRAAGDRFEPRVIRPGVPAQGRIQVLEGLDDDEEVVTRGQFMLDSESRLRAAGGGAGHGTHP